MKFSLELTEFRLISLMGSLCNLVAKVIDARLAKVIGNLIASKQYAFINSRQLVDGVVLVVGIGRGGDDFTFLKPKLEFLLITCYMSDPCRR